VKHNNADFTRTCQNCSNEQSYKFLNLYPCRSIHYSLAKQFIFYLSQSESPSHTPLL